VNIEERLDKIEDKFDNNNARMDDLECKFEEKATSPSIMYKRIKMTFKPSIN